MCVGVAGIRTVRSSEPTGSDGLRAYARSPGAFREAGRGNPAPSAMLILGPAMGPFFVRGCCGDSQVRYGKVVPGSMTLISANPVGTALGEPVMDLPTCAGAHGIRSHFKGALDADFEVCHDADRTKGTALSQVNGPSKSNPYPTPTQNPHFRWGQDGNSMQQKPVGKKGRVPRTVPDKWPKRTSEGGHGAGGHETLRWPLGRSVLSRERASRGRTWGSGIRSESTLPRLECALGRQNRLGSALSRSVSSLERTLERMTKRN